MVTITFECPVCQITRQAEIDSSGKRGIISVGVPASKSCPHLFLVFINEDLTIHRIQRIDHIVNVSIDGKFLARGMSLRGARKVFGNVFIDIITSLLLKRPVILCDEVDVAITLYNTFARVFQDPPELGRDILILNECDKSNPSALVVNCRYSVVVSCNAIIEAHKTFERFIDEAVAINDNEAAIVFVKQKIASLQKVVQFLIEKIEHPINAREVLQMIAESTGIRLRYSDLYAVRLILQGLGRDDVLDNLIMGDLDEF